MNWRWSKAIGHATPLSEYRAFLCLGVDGFFTDFPDSARRAIDQAS